jgi:cytoskeletal protein RodZ
MNPQEMFVTRLRRHRTRSRVSIEEMAANLRIRPDLLEGLERNDLTGWPRGVYSRAWIRAYALAVDLDPIDTVEEFCRLFPQGDRRTGGTIQEIASIVASSSEYRDEFSHGQGRRSTDQPVSDEPRAPWYAFVTQPGRALWNRLTGAEPAFRQRRAPGTHP